MTDSIKKEISGKPWLSDDLVYQDLPTKPRPETGTVLVTGASGYIGGRLVPQLIARGYKVRVMVRSLSETESSRWPGAEIVAADALEKEALKKVLKGVDTAYYLIHSLLLGPSEFEAADIRAAANFRDAAQDNGVKRIIYLGGLGDSQTSHSRHLRSRVKVAEELRTGSVPVTTLRAAVIIGSGSASYEIIHHLANRMPFLMMPNWAGNRCQPIGVRDVIKYLVGVLESPETAGKAFDIGGMDILTYENMLRVFGEIINKKLMITVIPYIDIRFYSYVTSLLTPVPVQIIGGLMEGLKDEVICNNDEIKKYVPFEPISYREAIIRALTRDEQDMVHTRWSDAYPPAHELAMKLHELSGEPTYTTTYSLLSEKGSDEIFKSVCRIGGKNGWFNSNWMWRARGGFDRLLSGVGTARGRKSYSRLGIGDVIDFWRVEDLQPGERLLLRAEMLLPGKAWLEFNIKEENGKRRLAITAHFYTDTTFGRAYWYAFLPFHHFIFNDLIEQIVAS